MVVSHATPPIRGKGGSGDRAYNKLFWQQDLVTSNQIRDLNLVLGPWRGIEPATLYWRRAWNAIGLALYVVARDVFVIIAF